MSPALTLLVFLQALMMLFGLNRLTGEDDSVFSPTYTGALLSNGLCCVGLGYYFFLMFRGYGILPFIRKPNKLLMPVPLAMVVLVIMTILKVNAWNLMLKLTLI